VEHLQHLVVSLVDHYGYVGIFLAMTAGNVGAPVGAEVLMPLVGGLVGTGHLSNLWLAIGAAVLGELAGNSIAYAIGRFGGVPIFEKYGKYVHFGHEQLARIHGFFERYGTFAIFICRFIPVIRGFVGIPAGMAQMSLAPFYLWTFLGSAVFCGGFVAIGYGLGDHLDEILPLIHKGGLALLALAVVIAVVAFFVVRARTAPQRAG
jgi:membrane protein DedA with SNARE-associated domain